MRYLALAAALAAVPAAAEAPADYRSTASITVGAGDAIHRLTLPFEAYRDARADLADLRVFNARGEALPIALASEPEATRETPPGVSLPIFPVAASPSAAGSANLDVVVRSNPDGTLVSVQGRPDKGGSPRPVAWILDASRLQKRLRALVVEWDPAPGTELAKVSVEGSDDLKAWRTFASYAPVVRLEQGGQKLVQPRIELGGPRAKYLRVSATPAAFMLSGAQAVLDEVVTPAERLTSIAAASPGEKPGQYLFDLGARLPVEALRVVLPDKNSVAPFAIAARDGESGPWRPVASATFYRLVREGVEIQSPAVAIPARPARYWSIQLDPRSPGIGAASPTLEAQWRPARLVFVARGDGPYALAFGNPDARRAMLAVGELIPGYEPRAEWKLPEAALGPVRSGADNEGRWWRTFAGSDGRKALLWALLVAAVLAMAWMAWRLQRQIREAPGGKDRGG